MKDDVLSIDGFLVAFLKYTYVYVHELANLNDVKYCVI
jgi:hypothetical protein